MKRLNEFISWRIILLHLYIYIDLDENVIWFEFNVLSEIHTERKEAFMCMVVVQFGKWKMSTNGTTISDNESRCFIRILKTKRKKQQNMMYKLFLFVMLKMLFCFGCAFSWCALPFFDALFVPDARERISVTLEVVKVYEPWQ